MVNARFVYANVARLLLRYEAWKLQKLGFWSISWRQFSDRSQLSDRRKNAFVPIRDR